MTPAERMEAALRSPDSAQALRTVALELAAEGCQKPAIYALLEKLLLNLRVRQDHRESVEDAVLDVMDGLAGWCHPDARLLPQQNLQ